MKRLFTLVILVALVFTQIYAQGISVVEKIKLTDREKDGEFFYPRMSPDGQKVFFTKQGYSGIWYYDIAAKQINNVTDKSGAGYRFSFKADGSAVLFRGDVNNESGIRVAQRLVEKNIVSSNETVIEEGTDLSYPLNVNAGTVVYTNRQKLSVRGTAGNLRKVSQINSFPVVQSGYHCMVVYVNGQEKTIAPLGEGAYIWTSVSPDGTKLLFTLSGKGTFISDLDGNIIAELGEANAPSWSPDGRYVVAMLDKDDGQDITASDIYLISADGSYRQQLTDTEDEIEMYPAWGANDTVLFNTLDGNIYLMKIKNN